jgi:hypothetical protein
MNEAAEIRFDRLDEAVGRVAAGVERHGDTLTIVSRQLSEIQRVLTPKPADGESSLERLLAQIVAQGQEQLRLLHGLAAMLGRMTETPGRGAGREQRANGSEHGAKS